MFRAFIIEDKKDKRICSKCQLIMKYRTIVFAVYGEELCEDCFKFKFDVLDKED